MIRTDRLAKSFKSRRHGRVEAVKSLTMRCEDGQIFALLGPNGAGKTTTLRMLSTLIEPTGGEAYIDELDIRRDRAEIRKRIGVVSYETRVYERMTPREIGYFFGRLNGLPDEQIAHNLEQVFTLLAMRDMADRRTDDFSTGMKQKTVVMRALVTAPSILIFDEPTAGLDVLTAKSMIDYLKLLRDAGKTILFSTHILWEAEKLADRIGIIHHGELAVEGTLGELRERTGREELEDIFFHLVSEESGA